MSATNVWIVLGKALLFLGIAAGGLALLAGLPLGVFSLSNFIINEMWMAVLIPGLALYLVGICVPLGIYHEVNRNRGKKSGWLWLPAPLWLAGGAVAAIGTGQFMLANRNMGLFWPLFVLGAALPPMVALAVAARRLPETVTWRRAAAGFLSGSLLSTHLTILLSTTVTILVVVLVLPLREAVAQAVASRDMEKVLYSPVLVFALIEIAIVAPLVEELTKPLGAFLLARKLKGPAEAFMVGMAGGAGFAVLENMLYESSGASVWAGITSLRAIGAVLHPLNAGMVAVGWWGVRNGLPGAWKRLAGLYGLAVGLHALWNGALVILYSNLGSFFFDQSWKLDFYGVGQPGIVTVVIVLEAILLWRLLFLATDRLRRPGQTESDSFVVLRLDQPRRLAWLAVGLLAVIVPVAALYGPWIGRYWAVAFPYK